MYAWNTRMLYEFLEKNQEEILASTEKKSFELAGVRPSSEQLRRGLPIFYQQLLFVLRLEGVHSKANVAGDSRQYFLMDVRCITIFSSSLRKKPLLR